jgi:hypothetical protein
MGSLFDRYTNQEAMLAVTSKIVSNQVNAILSDNSLNSYYILWITLDTSF